MNAQAIIDTSLHAPDPKNEVVGTVARARQRFDSGVTRPLSWRFEQLRKLEQFLRNEEEAINAALKSDLGRSDAESYLLETWGLLGEISHARKKLRKWAAPRKVRTPLALRPGSGHLRPEPLGLVLVIAPWNYPMYLALAPLVGVMASGNCAVIKPSELSPAMSRLLSERLGRYLDPECFPVVEGGVPETTALLEQRFDHICYTGGGRVARIVMAAAAKNLTPTTLELGGKSPCLVDKSANLKKAAKRIAWGKYNNSGQTCVAPDYVLATREVRDELVSELKKAIGEFYGSDPQKAEGYSRMVNHGHFDRVSAMIDPKKVAFGGQTDREDRYIAPTIMTDVTLADAVMQEEIFGPLLPIITIEDLEEAFAIINHRVNGGEKPLALYLFGTDRGVENEVLSRTSAGGVTINHTILHLSNGELPFGGVGESGMGAYHGKHGFDNFSHLKPVFKKANWGEPSFIYAPLTNWKRRALSLFA